MFLEITLFSQSNGLGVYFRSGLQHLLLESAFVSIIFRSFILFLFLGSCCLLSICSLQTNGDLKYDDERDDDDELHRERTGSRTSFMAGKFESSALACCGRRVSHVNKGNANDRSVQNVFPRSAINVP